MAENRTSDFLSLVQSLPDAERLRSGPTSIMSSSSASITIQQQQQQQSVASYTTGRYGGSSFSSSKQSSQQSYSQELRNFHKTAATISKDIAMTSTMLSELTQLVVVQSKSLFVDNSQKINSLVVRIKSNVENLNSRLDEANTIIQYQKRLLGSKNSQQSQEAVNVMGGLQDEFALATSGFKKILQARTDNLKDTTDQKLSVYGASSSSGCGGGTTGTGSNNDPSLVSLENKPHVYDSAASTKMASSSSASSMTVTSDASFPSLDLTSGFNSKPSGGAMAAGESTNSLPRPYGASGGRNTNGRQDSEPIVPTYSSSTSSYYGGGGALGGSSRHAPNSGGHPMSPYDMIQHEQQTGQDQIMQLIPDQTYLRERTEAMGQVETKIYELGTIFNKLAVMVNEHKEMVQKIDDTVDESASNINLSMEALTKTFTDQQSNRGLSLKVFGIFVLFIILFITFFA